jgi:putative DNA-invertase from lambdoid prophage Rac
MIDDHRTDVAQRLKSGASVSALSRAFKTSRQTIMRIRDAAPASGTDAGIKIQPKITL